MVLLDSNVFIFSKNQFYSPLFCPGFWDALDILFDNGKWCSLDKVYNELAEKNIKTGNQKDKEDYVSKWVKDRKYCFREFDAAEELRKIINYLDGEVSLRRYDADQVELFLSGADPYLIAYAIKHDLEIITNETYTNEEKYNDPKNKIKIKIPNVCKKFGVPYKMLWKFLQDNADIVNLVQIV